MSSTDLGFRRYQQSEPDQPPTPSKAERIADSIRRNVDDWYADRITELGFRKRQAEYWHDANERDVVDEVTELISPCPRFSGPPNNPKLTVSEETNAVEFCDECSGTRYPEEQHEERCSLYEEPMKCRLCGYYPCICGADERS